METVRNESHLHFCKPHHVGYNMVYTNNPVYEKSVILFYCCVDSGVYCDFNQSGKQPHENTGMTECGKFWLSSYVVVW